MPTNFFNSIRYAIAFVFLCQTFVHAQSDLDAEWKKWANTTLSDTVRVKALHNYAQQKYLNTNPDSAYYFSQLEFNFANNRDLKKFKGPALRTQSRALYRLGNYELALKKYEQALELYEVVEDKKGSSDALNGIGLIYRRQGDNVKAVQYHYKSLKLKEEIGDKIGVAKVLNNIGIIYYNDGDYDKAIDFYNRSLVISKEIDYKTQISRSLNNLGAIYDYLGKDSLALEYHKRSLTLSEVMDNFVAQARTLNNIGTIYSNQKKYDTALMYYSRSLKMKEKIGGKSAIAATLISISKVYFEQGKYDKSTVISKRALDLAIELNDKNSVLDAADKLYRSYRVQGRSREALDVFELYIGTKDFLDKEENQREVLRQEYKYEYDKKEAKLQADKAIQEQKIKNKNNMMIAGVIFLLIVIGFTINVVSNLKKQKILTKEIKISDANKQRLFGIVAHDLVNPFNAILGYTQLLEDDYDNFTEEERKQFISIINKYANTNYNLTKTLLDWSKSQQKAIVVNKVKLNYKTVVENAIEPYLLLADKKQISVNISIPDIINIEADKNIMQTVISNLFVNAVKYTPEKGTVTFHSNKNENNTVNLEIVDTGIGMTEAQLNNLFDITKTQTTRGTHNEKGNGLGLIVCKELIELQKGSLRLFSQLNKGSKAVITI